MLARFRDTTALTAPTTAAKPSMWARFAREEDGVLLKPTIAFFLSMLAVGGIGVDLMRMERDRTMLQYTLDRAVLAAADLDQPLSPPAVVQDYLAKAGLSEYYQTPDFDSGLGYKWVEASVSTTFEAHLLNFSGGASLPIEASSRAEESIDSLEISLVLDVSGSMNSNSRLSNLKVAARDFIDTMVANTTDGKMSISIIPYATQVSAPQELFDQYNVTNEHNYSRCINFTSSDYESASLSTTTQHERTMHFTPWSSYDNRTRYSTPRLVDSPVCEDDSAREMLVYQKDATTLKNFITNLSANGNTSIDIGMKWGTALLDPSAQPVINALSTGAGATVPSDFSARPAAYNDADTIKVIVLMTDGQNTSQYYVESDHRSGDSEVWYNDLGDSNKYGLYSTRRTSSTYYWHDYYGRTKYHTLGEPGESEDFIYRRRDNGSYYWGNEANISTTSQRLSWADLFAYTSLKYLYSSIYADWMGNSSARSTWYYGVYDYVGSSTKDNRTKDICDAAKAQGIVVYTIGFEAPSGGQAVLKDCASSDAHYFDVDGLEISDAFSSIATAIRQLRLTQ